MKNIATLIMLAIFMSTSCSKVFECRIVGEIKIENFSNRKCSIGYRVGVSDPVIISEISKNPNFYIVCKLVNRAPDSIVLIVDGKVVDEAILKFTEDEIFIERARPNKVKKISGVTISGIVFNDKK